MDGNLNGEDDDNKLIESISKFLESKKTEILHLSEIYPEEKSIVIYYEELKKFDDINGSSTASELRENPDKIIRIFEKEILKKCKFKTTVEPKIHVRFQKIPKRYILKIQNITGGYKDKLFGIQGVVNEIRDVQLRISNAAFQCPNCGNIQMVPQDKRTLVPLIHPYLCSKCKQKGQFRLITEKSESNEIQSEFTDIQWLEIQETLEFPKGSEQARKIDVCMEYDNITDKVTLGNVVEVIGIMRKPDLIPPKYEDTNHQKYVEANSIRVINKEFEGIEISEEDEKQIKEFSKDPKIYEKIIDCIAPSIDGQREIKEAIALQLFGGIKKTLTDGTTSRSDIHLLLIGDPGVAILIFEAVRKIAPKSIYVKGKELRLQNAVLASGGIVIIEEFDRINKDHKASMQKAMEQEPTIVSNGIVTPSQYEISVLASTNHESNIPPNLKSMFDLIFVIKDIGSDKLNEKTIERQLKNYSSERIEEKTTALDSEFLKKYITYAKKNIDPKPTQESESRIKEYYVKLRGRSKDTVPATARQLDALIRIAAASAKLNLRKTIEIEDVQNAVNLTEFVLREIATDKARGQPDIGMITQRPKSESDKIKLVEEVIERLTENGKKFVGLLDILRESEKSNINIVEAVKYIEELKKRGWIYEPEEYKYGLVR